MDAGKPAAPVATRGPDRITAGVLYMLAGMALIAAMDGLAKLLVERFPVGQVMFFRSVVSVPLLLSWFVLTRRLADCRPRRLGPHVARAVALMVAMWSFFIALKHMTLVDATVLAMTAPLFITALAVPLLGERVGWRRWAAVATGFTGVLVMLQPDSAGLVDPVALLPVLAALGYAVLMVLTRRYAGSEPVPALMLSAQFAVLIAGTISLPFAWAPMTWADFGLMAAAGVLVSLLSGALTLAYVYAPASLLAPLEYTALMWAALLGWIGWSELPGADTLIGAAIIVGSGLYVVERRKRRGAP